MRFGLAVIPCLILATSCADRLPGDDVAAGESALAAVHAVQPEYIGNNTWVFHTQFTVTSTYDVKLTAMRLVDSKVSWTLTISGDYKGTHLTNFVLLTGVSNYPVVSGSMSLYEPGASGPVAQVTFQRGDLPVDRVDHRQRDCDPFARVSRHLELVQEQAPGPGAQLVRCAADAVLIKRRLDALIRDVEIRYPVPVAQVQTQVRVHRILGRHHHAGATGIEVDHGDASRQIRE